jgi:hypothetical protein
MKKKTKCNNMKQQVLEWWCQLSDRQRFKYIEFVYGLQLYEDIMEEHYDCQKRK